MLVLFFACVEGDARGGVARVRCWSGFFRERCDPPPVLNIWEIRFLCFVDFGSVTEQPPPKAQKLHTGRPPSWYPTRALAPRCILNIRTPRHAYGLGHPASYAQFHLPPVGRCVRVLCRVKQNNRKYLSSISAKKQPPWWPAVCPHRRWPATTHRSHPLFLPPRHCETFISSFFNRCLLFFFSSGRCKTHDAGSGRPPPPPRREPRPEQPPSMMTRFPRRESSIPSLWRSTSPRPTTPA